MLGSECCKNPPNLSLRSGNGHVEKIGGLDSYVSGTTRSKLAIVLVSDIFGFKAPNLRNLADKLSASGFYVVVPDFFHGDSYSEENPDKTYPEWSKEHDPVEASEEAKTLIEALERRAIFKTAAVGFCWGGKVAVELAKQDGLIEAVALCHPANVTVDDIRGYEAPNLRKLADKLAAHGFCVVVPDFFHGEPYQPENPQRPLQEWLKDHAPEKAAEEAKAIIKAMKHKAVSKIAAVGMCWGAKVVVELAKQDCLQAAVLCHPALVAADDIREVKAPLAILGAEVDSISPPELLRQFEEILNNRPEVDGFVKIYPSVSHGWTVRYKPEKPEEVTAANEAHQDILNWIRRCLKPECPE